MGFIIDGIANIFFEATGHAISLMLTMVSFLKLDIAEKNGLFDSTFQGASTFKFAFLVTAFVLLILVFLLKLTTSLFGPITGGSEEPIALTISTLIAGFFISFSYSIFGIFQEVANSLLNVFKKSAPSKDLFKDDEFFEFTQNKLVANPAFTAEEAAKAKKNKTENGGNTNTHAFGGYEKSKTEDTSLTVLIISFVVFFVIMIQLLKLFIEMYERYVVLGVLFYTAPLAFVGICSKSTMSIFTSWVRMVISQFLLMMMNVFFLSVFAMSFRYVLDNTTKVGNDVFLFADWKTFITTTILWVSWLMVGQKIDQHLQSLGMSTAQSGGGVAGALIAGGASFVGAAKTAGRLTKSGIGHGYNTASRVKNGADAKGEGRSFLSGFMENPKAVRAEKLRNERQSAAQSAADMKNAKANLHTFDDNGRPKYNMDAADTIINDSKGVTGSEAKDLANAYDLNDTFAKHGKDPSDKNLSWSAKDGIITATDKNGNGTQVAVTDKGFDKAQRNGNALRPIPPSGNAGVSHRAEVTGFNSQTAKKDVEALANSNYLKNKEDLKIEGNTVTWTENGKEYKAIPSYLDTNKSTKPVDSNSFASDGVELMFNEYRIGEV